MTLAPVVRPYNRWRRRALLIALVGSIAGGYRYYEWVTDWHCTTQPELNQRIVDGVAIEAAEWTRAHDGCPTMKQLVDFAEDPADLWGKEVEITCDRHHAVLAHSAGEDGKFGTRDDQISSRSRLTPIEPP